MDFLSVTFGTGVLVCFYYQYVFFHNIYNTHYLIPHMMLEMNTNSFIEIELTPEEKETPEERIERIKKARLKARVEKIQAQK